ncbi:hypothetical protein B0H66DRAFT_506041 [Apodospora peruviana]|uniref:Uncharacterized protein n=1 Tax=Apodospora peruviana TaxID=516989 RepID=A0AAE0HT78_9PEZI|nr:hypothetical protein B0H66DRAFT_506041 [Apodospora peruviana]
MTHPIIIIASLLTTIRSTWELSHIVRKTRATKALKTEAKSTYEILQRAYRRGLLLEREFDDLFERLMCAEAHNNRVALREVQTDFQAILAKVVGQPAR